MLNLQLNSTDRGELSLFYWSHPGLLQEESSPCFRKVRFDSSRKAYFLTSLRPFFPRKL